MSVVSSLYSGLNLFKLVHCRYQSDVVLRTLHCYNSKCRNKLIYFKFGILFLFLSFFFPADAVIVLQWLACNGEL